VITGKVGGGIKEILDAMKIKEVSIENYLKNYASCLHQIEVLDYNKRIDGKVIDCKDFYKIQRNTLVERFTKVSDIVITGHFHGNNAPDILTKDMLQSKDCKIKSRMFPVTLMVPSLVLLDHPQLQNRSMVTCLLNIKKSMYFIQRRS
jgi:hypothetical protein